MRRIQRFGRNQETILAVLSSGEWVRTADLASATDSRGIDVRQSIAKLRQRGFLIEGDSHSGPRSRGYRMLPLPGKSWLPISHVVDFIRMTQVQGFDAADAQRMILEDIAATARRQMARAA